MEHNEKMKDFYNDDVEKKYGDDYEKGRWFSNEIDRSRYRMIKFAVSSFSKSVQYDSCFELGPGPGTWTKVLYGNSPTAKYFLLDISEYMKGQFKKSFGDKNNVSYNLADFGKASIDKKFDVVFSSRAIDYMEPKKDIIQKFVSLLKSGGRGFVIAKMDHPLKKKLLGQKTEWQHTHIIDPNFFRETLRSSGCKNIKMRPVTVYIPVLGRINLFNLLAWKILRYCPLSFWNSFLVESYSISFYKK